MKIASPAQRRGPPGYHLLAGVARWTSGLDQPLSARWVLAAGAVARLSRHSGPPADIARRGAAVQALVQQHARPRQLAGTHQRDDEGVLDEFALRMTAADADDVGEHR